jgi:hypothetical protein
MIRAASSPAAGALAAPEADCDYFAAETRYRSLANRIVAALRAGGGFILVTGHPPEGPHLLSQALRKSTQSRHEVIDIACRADLTFEELARARSVVAAPLLSGGATAALETSEPTPPLFVFTDLDQLSDQQIREIFEGTQNGDRKGTAVLLLAPSGFLIRLEQPSLQFLKERLAARFEFYEVGQEEGIEFLRHQLTARHARGEPRGIPPGIFRGLAASGVLLAVGIGAFLFLQNYQLVGEPSAGSAAGTTPARAAAAPRLPMGETPAAEFAPTVLNRPPIVAQLRPARPPKETAPRPGLAPAEDRTNPQATLPAAAPDPAELARTPQMTLPPAGLLPAQDAAKPQTLSPSVGQTSTQSARLPEPTLARPAPELQQTAPKAESRPASLSSVPSSANPRLSPAQTAALVTRGDGFLSVGDIASARLFYERAADAGNGSAVLRLGATFDTGFLSRAAIRGTLGDPVQAAFWYRRARELGDAAAEPLKHLGQQRAAEPNSPPR